MSTAQPKAGCREQRARPAMGSGKFTLSNRGGRAEPQSPIRSRIRFCVWSGSKLWEGRQCPDSEVRIIARHTRLRTSESKGHRQIYDSSVAFGSEVRIRTRRSNDAEF